MIPNRYFSRAKALTFNHLFFFIFVGCLTTVHAQKVVNFSSKKISQRAGVMYYKNKLYTGVVQFDRVNNVVDRTVSYVNGLKDGQAVIFGKNNMVSKTIMYKENLVNGLAESFFFNGKLQSTGGLVQPEKGSDILFKGTWKFYDKEGVLLGQAEYVDDKIKSGTMVDYHDNEQVSLIAEYQNFKQHGIFKTYTEKGDLIEALQFENGELGGAMRIELDESRAVAAHILKKRQPLVFFPFNYSDKNLGSDQKTIFPDVSATYATDHMNNALSSLELKGVHNISMTSSLSLRKDHSVSFWAYVSDKSSLELSIGGGLSIELLGASNVVNFSIDQQLNCEISNVPMNKWHLYTMSLNYDIDRYYNPIVITTLSIDNREVGKLQGNRRKIKPLSSGDSSLKLTSKGEVRIDDVLLNQRMSNSFKALYEINASKVKALEIEEKERQARIKKQKAIDYSNAHKYDNKWFTWSERNTKTFTCQQGSGKVWEGWSMIFKGNGKGVWRYRLHAGLSSSAPVWNYFEYKLLPGGMIEITWKSKTGSGPMRYNEKVTVEINRANKTVYFDDKRFVCESCR
jgi:antitoxin component YwqK of YwqJK toxin-antitoxin module